jgi:hypothetical protein
VKQNKAKKPIRKQSKTCYAKSSDFFPFEANFFASFRIKKCEAIYAKKTYLEAKLKM